jgi:DNA polymerase III delta subunit
MLLLTGDDDSAIVDARAAVLAAHPDLASERVDLREAGGFAMLLHAVGTPDLFGSARLVDVTGGETLRAADARALAAELVHTTAVVIIRGGTAAPHAAVIAALAPHLAHRHCAAPTGKDLRRAVQSAAAGAGVGVPPDSLAMIVELGAAHLPRVRHLLTALGHAGLTDPTSAQLRVLLGSAARDLAPWSVTDALEAGDPAAALDGVAGMEAQQLLAWLGRRAVTLALAGDALAAGHDAAAAVGGPPWQRTRTVAVARRADPAALRAAVSAVADATAAARGDVGANDALLLALAAAARPFTPDAI